MKRLKPFKIFQDFKNSSLIFLIGFFLSGMCMEGVSLVSCLESSICCRYKFSQNSIKTNCSVFWKFRTPPPYSPHLRTQIDVEGVKKLLWCHEEWEARTDAKRKNVERRRRRSFKLLFLHLNIRMIWKHKAWTYHVPFPSFFGSSAPCLIAFSVWIPS